MTVPSHRLDKTHLLDLIVKDTQEMTTLAIDAMTLEETTEVTHIDAHARDLLTTAEEIAHRRQTIEMVVEAAIETETGIEEMVEIIIAGSIKINKIQNFF